MIRPFIKKIRQKNLSKKLVKNFVKKLVKNFVKKNHQKIRQKTVFTQHCAKCRVAPVNSSPFLYDVEGIGRCKIPSKPLEKPSL